MALAEFDGETANMADILDEVRTGSLLAPTRVVIVRNADVLVTKKRREKSDTDHESKDDSAKANREALEKYIQSPCPTGVLVLVFNSLATSTRLYQLVEKLGGNISCKPPEKGLMPWLNQWLGAHARDAYRCALEPAAHKRLIDLVGTTLGLLDMELSKLATYIAPRTTISVADVEELVGASRMEKVFGITDCIARRDAKGALALWEQVVATDRAAPYRSVGGLAVGFRRLAEAKRLVKGGTPPFEAAKKLGIWTDATRLKGQLDRFSLSQWQDQLVKLLRIDVASKTGLGDVETAVEKFIVELCACN
jgi:DNA polymerase-3 subunit delta